MHLQDLTLEVRDKDLQRVALIPHNIVNFTLDVRHNNVGMWTCKLPSGHEVAEALMQPGSGIVVSFTHPHHDGGTHTHTLMSGPMLKHTHLATSDDPAGTTTCEGVTDSILLADALAWPDPSKGNVALQSQEHDVRSGPAESVMHAYVNANIGPGAPASRRGALASRMTMGTDGARGQVVAKAARFPLLGELIGEVALVSDLGFQIVQRGDALVFETSPIRDRTKSIRLDVHNGTLTAQKVVIAAPEVTDVIVAGKHPREADSEGNTVTPERIFWNEYRNAPSLEASEVWGRRIERYVSQTQTDSADELQQAADEALAEKGFTAVGVQVVPTSGETMHFGDDWDLGDRVTVVADGSEYVSVVTGYKLRIDSDGFFLSADLGDPKNFDPSIALRRRVQQSERRLSALERNG